MNNKKYLPIGSVVRLRGNKVKFMIVGVNAVDNEKEKFDYSAVIYPFGFVSGDKMSLFNSEDIYEVVSFGYADKDLNDFYSDINWLLDKEANNGK